MLSHSKCMTNGNVEKIDELAPRRRHRPTMGCSPSPKKAGYAVKVLETMGEKKRGAKAAS
jgi:hypothetical protein